MNVAVDFASVGKLIQVIYQNKRSDGRLTVVAIPSKANKKANEEHEERTGERLRGPQYRTVHQIVGPGDSALLGKFLSAWNGTSNLYFRQGRMSQTSTGRLEQDVIEVCNIWVDIDTRNHLDWVAQHYPTMAAHGAVDNTWAKAVCHDLLMGLSLPPTIVIDSGGGIQAHWRLKVSAMSSGEFEQVRKLNQLLSQLFSGDELSGMQSCMRLPGTLNVNYDPPVPAKILTTNDVDYQISDLRNWLLDTLGHRNNKPLFGDAPTASVSAPVSSDAQSEIDKLAGFLQSLGAPGGSTKTADEWDDIYAGLADRGRRNICATKLAGWAIRNNYNEDQTVDLLVDKGCTLSRSELRALVTRIHTKHIAKHGEADEAAPLPAPETVHVPPQGTDPLPQPQPQPASDRNSAQPDTAAAVDSGPAQPEPVQELPQPGDTVATFRTAVLDAIRNDRSLKPLMSDLGPAAFVASSYAVGVRYLHTKETIYQYTQATGIWNEIEAKTLEQAVHTFLATCGVLPSSNNVAEAVSTVLRIVHRPEVQWGGVNPRNRILCSNGVIINLDTGQTETPKPELYLRADDRIAAKWDANARAPMWTQAITTALSHVPATELQRTVDMIEEWMGSALLRKDKPRRLSRCMIYVGDANTGKSTVIHALRSVLGEKVTSAADAGAMDGPHAGMPLIGKMAWLTDELPMRARMNLALFKKLVTNEPVSINVKNKPFYEASLNLTIGYATNSLPTIDDDGTNAVWDRMMIVPFLTVFDQSTEIPDMKEILTEQRDGILQIMVQALARLRQRGQYDPPAFIKSYADQIRQEENPMEEFIKAAFTAVDQGCYIHATDIATACRGFKAVVGDKEDARRYRFNGRTFDAHLRRSWPNVTNGKEGHGNARVKRGLHFTQAGLSWLAEGQALEQGAGVPTDAEKLKAVNKRKLSLI